MWKIKVVTAGVDDKACTTLCFAGQELKKYLSQSTNEVIIIGDGEKEEDGAILIGVGLRDDLKKVDDPVLDDAILIDVKGHSGVITGVNARSALIAVYRYLTELGYTFIRPGKNGEKAPKRLPEMDVYVNEKPSYRHRSVCIEGSVTYESIEAMIDWLPKVGMNGYYTQFFTPLIFFQRWYSHKGYEYTNPYLKGEPLTPEDVNGMVRMLEREVEKRSLIYYKVGHGWTCEPFGMTSYGWDPVDPESIPGDVYKYFAEIGGERKIETTGRYAYVPMVAQLCYGDAEVRRIMVDYFVNYCKENPHIDYVVFGFGDGSNAQCECELCRDTRPADFLVLIMNEIVKELDAEGLSTKISFFMYSDTLWPPVKYKLEKKDRIFPYFSPISRTYTDAFETESEGKVSEFKLNQLEFPSSTGELIAYYNEWKEFLGNDSGVFDYYYMWDCYKDLGGTALARVIGKDIKNYRVLDLNGLISCQGQRVFCPTSLGMNVMARTLWNRDADFDTVRDYVIRSEYGDDFELVRDYLEALSIYSLPEVTRLEKPVCPENIPTYEKCLERLREFKAVIDRHTCGDEDCEAVSWKYLRFHNKLSTMLMTAFIDISNGIDPASIWQPIEEYINRSEWDMREYFDVFEFKFTYLREVFPQINNKDKTLHIGV
ncbi:MAG: DUF4838 domain-containing protein [Clostridia bacterium]|nr:DUF4838 domain-containing protein [Clostridia bacterium]